ncbi:FAD-dependent monooxygenase, partial [Acinetobacter baumannii]
MSNHNIRRALFAALSGQAEVDLVAGTRVSTTRTDAQAAHVRLNDGRELTARLLVAADSRFSAVRDQLGISARINRLGKAMLV